MMSLTDYSRKRTFSKTPEPPPAPPPPISGTSFCVQRHHARSLHYDFRLEVRGVLKSWAVPKGPTLDPAEKRLAVMVEDHPLDYGGFEGNIPAGNYGAGSVMLWDRGSYELLGDRDVDAQLERGDLKFLLHGAKLNGEFALVRMKNRGKGNEWLLLKKKDAYAHPAWNAEKFGVSVLTGRTQEEIARGLAAKEDPPANASAVLPSGAVRADMPTSIVPMQAFSADDPPEGADWLYEIKWDGVRAICFLEKGHIRLQSRNGNAMEAQYPELSVIPHYIDAGRAILDGEIAALDEQGRPSFARIQPRIMVSDAAVIANWVRTRPVIYFVFDLLYWNGYDLRRSPLGERKRLLASILKPCSVLRYSEHFEGNGKELRAATREQGLEGILAKRASSVYESRRSYSWLKIKNFRRQEFIICGYTKGERGGHFGALVLGVHEQSGPSPSDRKETNGGSAGDNLVWVGNVGTGFDQQTLEIVFQKLQPLLTSRSPFAKVSKELADAIWVRPERVAEVKFAEWTPDNRLRAPVFLGLREDSDPLACVREIAVTPEAVSEAAAASATVPSQADPKPKATGRRGAAKPPAGRQSAASSRSRSKNPAASGRDSAASATVPNPLDLSRPPLLTGYAETAFVPAGKQRLKFTNLNKVFYPQDGLTKRDVINFYDSVADLIIPHLANRPLSLKRYPNGIAGDFFFQKDAAESFPSWLRIEPVITEPGKPPTRFVVCDDRSTLLFLANLACIDENPWMSRFGTLANPDYILIDLDPQDCPYGKIVEAAQLVRQKLDLVELEGYPKTTGGDGMHIYVPLEPRYTYEHARSFAEILCRLVAAERPDLFTTPRALSRREKGKVYFDWAQIAEGKTIAAPYVLRAHPGAPVATPLTWGEVVPGLSPEQFHIRNALDRFARVGDIFRPVLTNLQPLEPALQKLEPLVRSLGR